MLPLQTLKEYLKESQAFRQVKVIDKGNADEYFLITPKELDELIGLTLKHIRTQVLNEIDKLNDL